MKFILPSSSLSVNYLSLLSSIIRVNEEILDFREFISKFSTAEEKDEISSEDPLLPSVSLRISKKDVVPEELPGRFFCIPEPEQVKNHPEKEKGQKVKEKPKKNQIDHKENDNLSGVSMGSSSISSSSSASSDTVKMRKNFMY